MVQGERIPYVSGKAKTEDKKVDTKAVVSALGLIGAVVIIGGFLRVKTLGVLLLCGVLGAGTFFCDAQAKGASEMEQKNTLTIHTEAEVESLTVAIYRVQETLSVEKAVEIAGEKTPLMTVEVKNGQKKVEHLAQGVYLLIPENTAQYRFAPQMVSLPVGKIDKVGAEKWTDQGHIYLKYEKIQEVKSPKTGERNWLQWILQPFIFTY